MSETPRSTSAQLAALTAQVSSFIRDSEEYRKRSEHEQNAIWSEIRNLAKQLNDAVAQLSSKGAITWPIVVSTIAMMLGLLGAASTIGKSYVDAQVRRLESSDDVSYRDSDRVLRRLEKLEDARVRDLEAEAARLRGRLDK